VIEAIFRLRQPAILLVQLAGVGVLPQVVVNHGKVISDHECVGMIEADVSHAQAEVLHLDANGVLSLTHLAISFAQVAPRHDRVRMTLSELVLIMADYLDHALFRLVRAPRD
jgi:hypothetical protein